MSIIPKIKVSTLKKRTSFPANADCSTTSNIGSVQPTFCREMFKGAKFKMKVSSLVRLASMPTPTFGRLSLRHYHCFVPYSQLWEPFNFMLSGQPYQAINYSNAFVPMKVPYFKMSTIRNVLLKYCDFSFALSTDLSQVVTITGDDDVTLSPSIIAAKNIVQSVYQSTLFNSGDTLEDYIDNLVGADPYDGETPGVLNFGNYAFCSKVQGDFLDNNAWAINSGVSPTGRLFVTKSSPITYEGADMIVELQGSGYSLLCKFKPVAKRLRQVVIGLGYGFNPWDTSVEFSLLKFLAYYKCWFELFSPVRERAFQNTNCYKLIKRLSSNDGFNLSTNSDYDSILFTFLAEIAKDCYYYLPVDYYSMALDSPGYSGSEPVDLSTPINRADLATVTSNEGEDSVWFSPDAASTALGHRLAEVMLRFSNKNTVVGRNIREYLKVHFGYSEDSAFDSMSVNRIGSSRVMVNISDIMSTAESDQGYLGEYGGRGIGYGSSPDFEFEAKDFGVWITLTTIVPESGYYQGFLKENTHLERLDFFHEEFDAVGYQALSRGEIMNDFTSDSPYFRPNASWAAQTFGFVPRYSEYKVGRNIVNGDLSLRGLSNAMSPYFLDRKFPDSKVRAYSLENNFFRGVKVKAPDYLPEVVHDTFRRIDPSDHIGQYNRIFNYGGNDLDHFIIHSLFKVTVTSPALSLRDSFDTIQEDEYNDIDVIHS